MKFETSNAVADVDQRRTGISLDNTGAFLDGFENEHTGPIRHRFILARNQIIKRIIAALVLVKRLGTGIEHLLNICRDRLALGLHTLDRLANTDRVPGLKNTYLPAKPPLDSVVDLNDRVGDFGDPIGRVTCDARGCFPEKFADAVVAPNQFLYTLGPVLYLLCRVERGELGFYLWFIFKRREIEFEDDALALGIRRFLEKSALGFIA